MSKTFTEVFNEIKEGISVSKKGKPVITFSKSDFEKLAKAYVNEVDYTTEVCSVKAGDLVKDEVKPVEMFRGMIKRILKDFGVDEQEASRVMDSSYEIKSVNGIYEFISELLYKYMEAGKKFDFMTKEDFQGSVYLADILEETKTFANIKKKDADGNIIDDGRPAEVVVKKKAHKVIKQKSKCPEWLKERM